MNSRRDLTPWPGAALGPGAPREALMAAYQVYGRPWPGRSPGDGLTAWPTLEAPPLD
jgi:hypothetical protein